MKVCTLTASVSRKAGGLFTSVRRLSQSLTALPDAQVNIVGVEDEFTQADSAEWNPLSPQCFPAKGPASFGFSPALKQHLLQSDYDLIHQHGLWQFISVAVSGWHKHTAHPYLISARGMLDPWALANSRWKKRIAGWCFENENLRRSACLHALGEAEAKAMRAYGLKNPICVIPNGIDLPIIPNAEKLKPETLKSESPNVEMPEVENQNEFQLSAFDVSAFTAGRKVLLYLGRIHPKKGLINLLRAWAEVRRTEDGRRKAEEWILVIAGWDQGGHEGELKSLATELGLSFADVRSQKSEFRSPSPVVRCPPSVLFLGPQFGENKAAYYRGCDAFILPSFSEGLPMVVLESWAYGKPVLMTPECNLPEGFAANAAIRIEPSVESIVQGLLMLFQSSTSDLQSTGSRGRALVAGKFAWPKIASDMRAVYEWVLGGRAPPACVWLK
jgi:poly(glycerol-phosphate) alpha-glucosyltransferase